MENGWDNTKREKTPYLHCGPSVKNCRIYRVCRIFAEYIAEYIEDSNNNNDNITEALNNHCDNSICLIV